MDKKFIFFDFIFNMLKKCMFCCILVVSVIYFCLVFCFDIFVFLRDDIYVVVGNLKFNIGEVSIFKLKNVLNIICMVKV